MMNRYLKSTLASEQGSAVIIAVLFLILMTIIGVTMIQNTTLELQIVRNDMIIKDHLHRAEAASMEGSQWIENASVETLEDLSSRTFISQSDLNLTALNLNDGTWNMSEVDPGDGSGIITGFRIVDETGIVDLTQTNLHTYKVYGYYNRPSGMNRGEALVEIGYKRRF
ncbi:MAG: hypothetical protein AMJ54_15865 [Deltaproteobacteria bacterium SG8_13]|nr:MAG: hypothetical protein AMJ54_15865 [Deltaproteobacteria bacterium SG8_13]